MSGILKIKLGEEYRAKVESVGEFESSIFEDVYRKAFSNVAEIINNEPKTEKDKKKIYENYNNIIAFVGERGTGKTSAMLSVSGALKKVDGEKLTEKYDFKVEKDDRKISDYKYEEVGIIDPSLLTENSNIMEIIIAKMFSNFKKKVETKNHEVEHSDKRNLISAFEKVFGELKTINGGNDIFKADALDALLKLSATVDLKDSLSELVKCYLEFMNKGESKYSKLLLEIDDIDLNTKHAFEMVEQIRKYFIIPNVIILMAVKIEQLGQIIEKNYQEEFKEMLKDEVNMSFSEIKNMTEKYLLKLIPFDRRLYLPMLQDFSNKTRVVNLSSNICKTCRKKINCGECTQASLIEIELRREIYRKTGLLFLKQKYGINYIVPKNLRELMNLFKILEEMNISKNKNRKQENENRKKFKEYFFNSWCKDNLNDFQWKVIIELSNRNIPEKNKYIINELEAVYKIRINENSIYKNTPISKEYEYITSPDNNPRNISLGDVLFVLKRVDYYTHKENDKKFIFAIKTLYSILLYELYFQDDNSLNTFEEYSEYQILVGGFFYNPLQYRLIKNIKRPVQIIDRCVLAIKEIDNESKKILSKFIISYKTLSKDYRMNSEVFYSTINGKHLEGTFDILGFFFNEAKGNNDEKLYIGNIEYLEKMLEYSYFVSSTNIIDLIKNFFMELENIELNEGFEIKRLDENRSIWNFILGEMKPQENKLNFNINLDDVLIDFEYEDLKISLKKFKLRLFTMVKVLIKEEKFSYENFENKIILNSLMNFLKSLEITESKKNIIIKIIKNYLNTTIEEYKLELKQEEIIKNENKIDLISSQKENLEMELDELADEEFSYVSFLDRANEEYSNFKNQYSKLEKKYKVLENQLEELNVKIQEKEQKRLEIIEQVYEKKKQTDMLKESKNGADIVKRLELSQSLMLLDRDSEQIEEEIAKIKNNQNSFINELTFRKKELKDKNEELNKIRFEIASFEKKLKENAILNEKLRKEEIQLEKEEEKLEKEQKSLKENIKFKTNKLRDNFYKKIKDLILEEYSGAKNE